MNICIMCFCLEKNGQPGIVYCRIPYEQVGADHVQRCTGTRPCFGHRHPHIPARAEHCIPLFRCVTKLGAKPNQKPRASACSRCSCPSHPGTIPVQTRTKLVYFGYSVVWGSDPSPSPLPKPLCSLRLPLCLLDSTDQNTCQPACMPGQRTSDNRVRCPEVDTLKMAKNLS